MKRLFILLLFLSACGVEKVEVYKDPPFNIYTYVVSGNCHKYKSHVMQDFGTTDIIGPGGTIAGFETNVEWAEAYIRVDNLCCQEPDKWVRCEIKKNGNTVIVKTAPYPGLYVLCRYYN